MAIDYAANLAQRALEAWAVTTVVQRCVAMALGFIVLYSLSPRSKFPVAVVPKLLPLEIALMSYLVTSPSGRKIASLFRRGRGSSIFGFHASHQVLCGTPGSDRFLGLPHNNLSTWPSGWTIAQRVFGVDNDPAFAAKLSYIRFALNEPVRDLFVNTVAASAAIDRADIPGHARKVVTFHPRGQDQQELWEQSADVRLTESGDGVEANLLKLIRDFGSCISTPQLYGADFLRRYKGILNDLWYFDNEVFPLLVVGLPSWLPIRPMRDGLAARARIHDAFYELYDRVDQWQQGKPMDEVDVSDVSSVTQSRCKLYREEGVSIRHRAQVESSLFWAQNANTQPLVFWMVLYVYSTPGLADELRKEVAPYLPVGRGADGHLEITSTDFSGMMRDCTLLKSSMFETFRLANEATSIRYLHQPETVEDAAGVQQHFPANTWVTIPHAVTQRDPALYPNPEKFIPDRFIDTDAESGKSSVRYGKLRPWGYGIGICKGRTFAEREILSIVASLLVLWDITPVDGAWVVPPMRPGTGVNRPVHDVRVVFKRRT